MAIAEVVGRSAPLLPITAQFPADAPASGFAAGSGFDPGARFSHSATGRRVDPADTTRIATDSDAVRAAVGTLTTQHADHAHTLLARLPAQVRELAHSAAGAKQVMLGLDWASTPGAP